MFLQINFIISSFIAEKFNFLNGRRWIIILAINVDYFAVSPKQYSPLTLTLSTIFSHCIDDDCILTVFCLSFY